MDDDWFVENVTTFVEISNVQVVGQKTAMFYANLIKSTIIATIVGVFGVVSNAINMAVFLKIGFKDSINMSLFALAISDFGTCFFLFPGIVANFPWMNDFDLPVQWQVFARNVAGWPHTSFTKITTLITAFITFERCICVYMPLKVKTIISRKRTKCFLVFCFCLIGALVAPVLYANRLGWIFVVEQNRTMLGMVSPLLSQNIEKVISPIFNVLTSIVAFTFIIVSTVVLVVTLKKQSQWRLGASAKTKTVTAKSNNSTSNTDTTTTKEQKITKMVVIISTLFIVTLFPTVVLTTLLWADKRFDFGGSYFNIFVLMIGVTHTLDAINAAFNIVIYYKNNSNYRAMFDQTFRSKNKAKSST